MVISSWVFTVFLKQAQLPKRPVHLSSLCSGSWGNRTSQKFVFWWGEADKEQVQNRRGWDTHTKKVSIEEGRGFLTSRMDTLTPLPWGTRVGKSPVLSGQSEEAAGPEELQSIPDTMQAGKEKPGEPGQSWRLVLALEAGVCFGDFGSLRW